MNGKDSAHCTFGDGTVAAGRLERLAGIYRITSMALLEGLQANHDQVMCIGRELEGRVRDAGFQVVSSRPRKAGVSAAEMASLHRPNLESIRSDPWVRERYDDAVLDELDRGLAVIEKEPGRRISIEDVLRQIVARA